MSSAAAALHIPSEDLFTVTPGPGPGPGSGVPPFWLGCGANKTLADMTDFRVFLLVFVVVQTDYDVFASLVQCIA